MLVEIEAGGKRGLGFTYADRAIVSLIRDKLAGIVIGRDALAVPAAWIGMVQAIRNLGRPGLASMAIAAVDSALWDLKAKLLGLPLIGLLGAARPSITFTAAAASRPTPWHNCKNSSAAGPRWALAASR